MSNSANQFKNDVIKGLKAYPKFLPSMYIYDKEGDKLFQDIMAMPEYYLTNCEFEIFNTYKTEICKDFANLGAFDLIELGAGDGKKTKILLEELVSNEVNFSYIPIDISQNALDGLNNSISAEMPEVDVQPMQGTYFEVLSEIEKFRNRKKVILFLGSNIGNLLHDKAIGFLKSIQENMNNKDHLFVGFDQKKNPQTILNAYNDKAGITEKFNKNLLLRINKTFNANFNLEQFSHWEMYNPETGTAKSFIVSKKAQTIDIKSLRMIVSFKAWETIHVEISQKYDDDVVEWLSKESGLKIINHYADSKKYYKNYLFQKDIK